MKRRTFVKAGAAAGLQGILASRIAPAFAQGTTLAWLRWNEKSWDVVDPPVISRTHFVGTGTRFLSDDGRAAIRGLFERTFRG